MNKQQIIDYVNAGYEVEIESFAGDIYDYTIIGIARYDVLIIEYKRDNTVNIIEYSDVEDDKIISIKPRPFTPLPVGTEVERFTKKGSRRTGRIAGYTKSNRYRVVMDSNGIHLFYKFYELSEYFNPIIKQEEEKDDCTNWNCGNCNWAKIR